MDALYSLSFYVCYVLDVLCWSYVPGRIGNSKYSTDSLSFYKDLIGLWKLNFL